MPRKKKQEQKQRIGERGQKGVWESDISYFKRTGQKFKRKKSKRSK